MPATKPTVLVVEDTHRFLRMVGVVLDPSTAYRAPCRLCGFPCRRRARLRRLLLGGRLHARWRCFFRRKCGWWKPSRRCGRRCRAAPRLIVELLNVDRQALAAATGLRIVQKHGLATRNIDTEACAAQGIKVLTHPAARQYRVRRGGVGADADPWQRTLIGSPAASASSNWPNLGYAYKPFDLRHTPNSNWARISGLRTLNGSTIGIIGLGEIGREIAILQRRRSACASSTISAAACRRRKERELNATYSPLGTLLAESDWLVPQLPGGAATRLLHDRARFAQMKPGACLVNISRADIVDRAALIEALKIRDRARRLRARSALPGARPAATTKCSVSTTSSFSPHIAAQPRFNALEKARRDDGSEPPRSSRHEAAHPGARGRSMSKAFRFHRHGGPEVLRFVDVEVGEPGPGEVRIRNTAVAVNYRDVLMRRRHPCGQEVSLRHRSRERRRDRRGRPRSRRPRRRRPRRLCGHAGGLLRARRGSCPPRASSRCRTASMPRRRSSMMIRGMTARFLLLRDLQGWHPATRFWIHAAAGGVGLIMCQWAKHLGATVIGTVSSDAKAAVAHAHGCDHPIVYTREDFAERVREITGGEGVPVVYDLVGKSTFEGSLRCLAPARNHGVVRRSPPGDPDPVPPRRLGQAWGRSISPIRACRTTPRRAPSCWLRRAICLRMVQSRQAQDRDQQDLRVARGVARACGHGSTQDHRLDCAGGVTVKEICCRSGGNSRSRPSPVDRGPLSRSTAPSAA